MYRLISLPSPMLKAWFPLNRRTIGDCLRQSATVCDVLPILPDLMETLAYDPYDCLGPSAITDRKAWFPLNRRTIGDSLRQSATVCDLIFHFPAETCFHRSATVCDCLRLSATMILFKLKKSIFNFDLTPNQRAGIRYSLIG